MVKKVLAKKMRQGDDESTGKISKDGGLRKHASREEDFPRQFFFHFFLLLA